MAVSPNPPLPGGTNGPNVACARSADHGASSPMGFAFGRPRKVKSSNETGNEYWPGVYHTSALGTVRQNGPTKA